MILSQLPAPARDYSRPAPREEPVSRTLTVASVTKEPPPYGSQERNYYRPRKQEDFCDGGECLSQLLRSHLADHSLTAAASPDRRLPGSPDASVPAGHGQGQVCKLFHAGGHAGLRRPDQL